jgi:uncharacterized Zn finger protein
MVRARLHIICGNCGCNDEFEYRIVKDGHDNGETQTPAVYIVCNNCVTLHDLSDTIKEKDRDVLNGLEEYEEAQAVEAQINEAEREEGPK